MGLIGGELGYRLLRAIAPSSPSSGEGSSYRGKSKLRTLLGDRILSDVKGRVVLDFGCGTGAEVIELAQEGARQAIGLDSQPHLLEHAQALAREAGVDDRTRFVSSWDQPVDLIVSLDAFEHFGDVDGVLRLMHDLLRPGGEVVTSFGPTWLHPLGGHLFSVFPWAHLVFTERALIRWRADFKDDGSARFSEVTGGLNRMTIRRFEEHVHGSPLTLEALEAVPIRRLEPLAGRLTREFTTSVVKARLRRPAE